MDSRTLAVFVQGRSASGGADLAVFQKNRAIALSYLKSLSEKKAPHLDESCIMAWGQLGRYVNRAVW